MKIRIYELGPSSYQVRVFRWYWPFWITPGDNVQTSLENAEAYARGVARVPDRVVKTLVL